MKDHRLFGLMIVLLGIGGLAFWLLSIIEGRLHEMMQGIGVEILGALVTALGVIGIEKLYTKPDSQIELLHEKLDQQSKMIAKLQSQLKINRSHKHNNIITPKRVSKTWR